MIMNRQYDVVVIGAGPAGLLAAGKAAMEGARVLVLEKMEKPARKLRITGKGRCNITNLKPLDEFLAEIKPEPRFLRDAFGEFFSNDIIELIESQGVGVVVERGQRAFPTSGKAWDVAEALIRWAKGLGVSIVCHATVTAINLTNNSISFVAYKANGEHLVQCESVVLATGGKSYPATGSTGEGFLLAEKCGHRITPLRPTLVGLETSPVYDTASGLLLKNVNLSVFVDGKKISQEFGELENMPYGLGGAIALRVSREVVGFLDDGRDVELEIDFKPALNHEKIDKRLLREIDGNPKMGMIDLARKLLPKQLAEIMLDELGIAFQKIVSRTSSDDRKLIRLWLKEKRFSVTGYRPWNEAIATAGGVSLKEVNPHTMESKLVKGLYFGGEVLDLDGATGGFNLQIAYSTGWLAGKSAAATR
ncbi:MAG TPA: aminoacetone oxidase family FAD-binding enzyme [Bacteroidales bacterium]|nr:aminoacetone oxidase family FAD-binding enzyme [Bacteroidales bacterium]